MPDAVAAYPHCWIAVGQFGRFLPAGARRRLPRPRPGRRIGTPVDPPGAARLGDALVAMPRIIRAFRGGDDHLLTGIGRIFEGEGFRLLGAHEVAPDIVAPGGRARAPSARCRRRSRHRSRVRAAGGAEPVRCRTGRGDRKGARCSRSRRRRAPTPCCSAIVALREAGRIGVAARRRRARQGAEAAPGPPLRSALDRAGHRAECVARPGSPASRSSPAAPSSPNRSASSKPPTASGLFVLGRPDREAT